MLVKKEFKTLDEYFKDNITSDIKLCDITMIVDTTGIDIGKREILHKHLGIALNSCRYDYEVKHTPSSNGFLYSQQRILATADTTRDYNMHDIRLLLERIVGNSTYTLDGGTITIGTIDDICSELNIDEVTIDVKVDIIHVRKDSVANKYKYDMSTYINFKDHKKSTIPIFAKMFKDNLVINTYDVSQVTIDEVSQDILSAINFDSQKVVNDKSTKDIRDISVTNRMSYDVIFNREIVDLIKPTQYGNVNVLDTLLFNIVMSLRQHISKDVLRIRHIMSRLQDASLKIVTMLISDMRSSGLNKSRNVLADVLGDHDDINLTGTEAWDLMHKLVVSELLYSVPEIYDPKIEDETRKSSHIAAFAHILRENNYDNTLRRLNATLSRLNYYDGYIFAEYPLNTNKLFGHAIHNSLMANIYDYETDVKYMRNIYTALGIQNRIPTRAIAQDILEYAKKTVEVESNVSEDIPSDDEKSLKEEIQDIFDKMDE